MSMSSVSFRAGRIRSMCGAARHPDRLAEAVPSLAEGEIEKILSRGTRLDEAIEGQGIGLAVVADIVESYNIELGFSDAGLGGLKVSLEFQSA